MADNFDHTGWLATDKSRSKDRGSNVKTTIIGRDLTPGGAAETLEGDPLNYGVRYAGAQTDTIIVTPTAGKRLVLRRIRVIADAANTVNPSVIVGFGTASTPSLPSTKVAHSHPGLPAGLVSPDDGDPIGIGAVNDKLYITTSGGTVDVNITYSEA